MVAGRARWPRPPRPRRRRPAAAGARAGWSSPGCACAARRPSAAPGRRGRGRRSARCARAGARAAGRRGRAGSAPARRLVVAHAEPQRAPRPLVERRERARARALVLHDPHGIEGEQTPVIGPTWPSSLPQRSRISPTASRAAAASRSAAQPSSRHAATSARRCGSQTRSQSIGGPACSSVSALEPLDHLAGRGDGHHVRARALRSRTAPPRWPLDRARRARPRPAPAAPRPRRRRRPAGASRRRPRRPPATRTASAKDSRPDVDGAHALQHAGARVMTELAHLAAAVRAAPGLQAKRELRAARAPRLRARRRRRGARRARRRPARALRRGHRPRSARGRPVRGRRRGGRHQRGRRSRHGRAAPRARRHARQPRPRPRRDACSTAWRGRPSGSPCRSSAATSRSAPRRRCRPSAPAP